jgi:hypothetical protein
LANFLKTLNGALSALLSSAMDFATRYVLPTSIRKQSKHAAVLLHKINWQSGLRSITPTILRIFQHPRSGTWSSAIRRISSIIRQVRCAFTIATGPSTAKNWPARAAFFDAFAIFSRIQRTPRILRQKKRGKFGTTKAREIDVFSFFPAIDNTSSMARSGCSSPSNLYRVKVNDNSSNSAAPAS